MDPRKILKVLNSREEDSKRLDSILESMMNRNDLTDKTILYFPNGYFMHYDTEFKVFEAGTDVSDLNNFKDGREAIDFCLHNDEYEEQLRWEDSERKDLKDSDVGELPPASERGIEHSANNDVVDVEKTVQNEQEKEN